ncbi:MAG: hypothetical protein ACRCUE_13860, partial [Bosea sp. (in: a-proteobacteria)]
MVLLTFIARKTAFATVRPTIIAIAVRWPVPLRAITWRAITWRSVTLGAVKAPVIAVAIIPLGAVVPVLPFGAIKSARLAAIISAIISAILAVVTIFAIGLLAFDP